MTLKARLRYAAATAAALTLAALVAPAANAYPVVDALTPGATLATYSPTGALDGGCTAGWLARNASGDPFMLTAGHCGTGVGSRYMLGKNVDGGNYTDIGSATHVVDIDNNTDIAVVAITEPVALDARVLQRRPVSGAVALVTPGDQVCTYGAVSGRLCGEVLSNSTEDGIVAALATHEGDSGAPVYRIRSDGVADAVGILRGGLPGKATVQLIGDTLREQGLTLIQDVPAPRAGVAPISNHGR